MIHPVVKILNAGGMAELVRADRTDGQLLDQFVKTHDQDAFATLVRRHGGLVLGVCRRVLRDPADADDAFQAAFLVLARKAATLRSRGLLANWLHGVAYNTARRLLRANQRRAARERPLDDVPEPIAEDGIDLREELLAILDEELGRLPERYRVPIVLCDLEGATRKEAARLIGCPEGTVAGRLARARALLAERLAGRGIAPTAGILAAILTAREATAGVLASSVMRAVAGDVSVRVASLAERVVAAMFVSKVKSAFVAIVICGIVFAGLASVFRANAIAEPAAPPEEKTAKPAGGAKVLTVIPLRKLEPEPAARVIAERYENRGVTVAAIPDDRAILLYADAKTTGEIEDVLVKLGEPRRRIATVVPLFKHTDATEMAAKLRKFFPTPTIIPVPKENVLLVYGTATETAQIKDALQPLPNAPGNEKPRPVLPAPGAELKTFTVNLKNVPWKEAIAWYAEASGLSFVGDTYPKGTVTLQPPKGRKLTLAEVTDLFNEALIQQKFLLIRRKMTFILHPTDEKVDPSWVPRIELSDLGSRGKTELVQVLIPLKFLSVEDTAPEIKRLLTPFGTVASLSKTNTLVILDTAGNISRIYEAIQKAEGKIDQADTPTHICKYKKAQEVADHLKKLLDKKNPAKPVGIVVDARANSVTVSGPPEKIAEAKKIIEEFDKGDKPYVPADPELRKYSVPVGTADAIAKTLLAENPALRILAVNTANEIWVMATPEEHFALIGKPWFPPPDNKPIVTAVSIPLANSDPNDMSDKLRKLFPGESGPQVEAGAPGQKTIIVRGTPEQIEAIRKTVERIEKGK